MRRPLIGLVLCVIVGTWASMCLATPFLYPFWAACVMLLGWLAARTHRPGGHLGILLLPAVVLTVWASAAYRMEAPADVLPSLSTTDSGLPVEIVGVVTGDPVRVHTVQEDRSSWRFQFKPERIRAGRDTLWQQAGNTISVSWVSPQRGKPPRYGDRWQISGTLQATARMPRAGGRGHVRKHLRGNWYRSVHLSGGHGNGFVAWCYEQRHSTADCLSLGIEDFPDHVAMIHALVLGYRQKIPREIWESFALTGSLHIFAISGLHVGMVAFIIVFVLTAFRISRIYWTLFLTPLLLVYTIGTGMRASAIRACIMAIIFFSAPLLKRRADGLSTLALAAMVILIATPMQLLDRGFIFSFVVVTGLIVLYRHVYGRLATLIEPDPLIVQEDARWLALARAVGRRIASLAAISLSAWLAAAPLSAFFFGQFTPVALLSNLMVVPLTFLIVLSGALSLILGSCLSLMAEVFNHANLVLIAILQKVIATVALVPYGSTEVSSPPLYFLVLWYAGLLIAARWLTIMGSGSATPSTEPQLDIK